MLERYDPGKREAWKRDLDQIKALGFNTVRCWAEWTAVEPAEGQWDFRTLDAVLDLAHASGLRAIVQVYADSAPEWAGAQFPDGRFVAQNGDAISSQAAPGLCIDHPGVRRVLLGFYAALAEHVRAKPAFFGWDLWSEPHIINWVIVDYVPNAQFCYCVNTRTRFRRWLQQQYGSLNRLNAAWYRTFQTWDEVDPPRFGTILSYTDFVDWKSFIGDKLAEDLAARAETVKRIVPGAVATSHAAVPNLLTSPYSGDGTPDDWKMSRAPLLDFFGVSLYPKWLTAAGAWPLLRRAASLDFTRSMTMNHGGFYVGELQAGFGTRGATIGIPVTGADLRDWAWTAIAHGARAVNLYAYYPMSSGYESGGYGLVRLDGTLTDRSRAIGQAARTVSAHSDLLARAQPARAEVAVLYNPLAHLVGGAQSEARPNVVRDALTGVYAAFYHQNIPVDFLHADDVARLPEYKVLFVPYAPMLAAPVAKALIEFVRQGGTVVAEARTAWNDEQGHAQPIIPGFGLHELFGAREHDVRPAEKTTIEVAERRNDEILRASLQARLLEEVLEPQSAGSTEVLGQFSDGSPAATRHHFGKGTAILIGSYPSLAAAEDKETATFLLALVRGAGVSPPLKVATDGGFIEARLLEAGGRHIVFVFNREDREVTARIDLVGLVAGRGAVSPLPRAQELETGIPVFFQASGGHLTVARTLRGGEIWIVELEQP